MKITEYMEMPEYRQMSDILDLADSMSVAISYFCKSVSDFSALERVTLELSSGIFSLLFAARKLVSIGYLMPSKILVRAVIDKTGSLAWIRSKGDAGIAAWESGWKHRDRPNLREKLTYLHEFDIFEGDNSETLSQILQRDYVDILNGDTHGDMRSALLNSATQGEAIGSYAAGPNPFDRPQARVICKLLTVIAVQFLTEVRISIPRLEGARAA